MPDALPARTEDEAALDAALLALMTAAASGMAALALEWAAGDLLPGDFGDAAEALLEDAHAEAAVLGRTLAGRSGVRGPADDEWAALRMEGEASFLHGFVADLEAGRYLDDAGAVQAESVAARARLYGAALLGTAYEVWVEAQPETTLYYWHLGAAESGHCGDCPGRELGSPYTRATLPGVPGDGSTACLTNCRCWLSTGSGRIGFVLPVLPVLPAAGAAG